MQIAVKYTIHFEFILCMYDISLEKFSLWMLILQNIQLQSMHLIDQINFANNRLQPCQHEPEVEAVLSPADQQLERGHLPALDTGGPGQSGSALAQGPHQGCLHQQGQNTQPVYISDWIYFIWPLRVKIQTLQKWYEALYTCEYTYVI